MEDPHYDRMFQRLEAARWELADIPFDTIDKSSVSAQTLDFEGESFDHVIFLESIVHMEEAGLVPFHLQDISADYRITLAQWLHNLDRHAEEMQTIDARTHTMLRRYLMIALGTYRAGGTVCHLMASRRPGA